MTHLSWHAETEKRASNIVFTRPWTCVVSELSYPVRCILYGIDTGLFHLSGSYQPKVICSSAEVVLPLLITHCPTESNVTSPISSQGSGSRNGRISTYGHAAIFHSMYETLLFLRLTIALCDRANNHWWPSIVMATAGIRYFYGFTAA